MNQALKQRLVGALVLAALAIIFLPVLFNGGRPKPIDVMQGIAPMPTVAPITVQEPVHPQDLPPEEPGKNNAGTLFPLEKADDKVSDSLIPEDAPPEDEQPAVAATTVVPAPIPQPVVVAVPVVNAAVPPASDPPKLKANGLPQAWVLQVGVFSDKSKANALKASLQAQGYRAFTRSVTTGDKTVTRVLIGPEVQASAIAKIKSKVDKTLSIKAMVVRFES